jgi:hypothetical protein
MARPQRVGRYRFQIGVFLKFLVFFLVPFWHEWCCDSAFKSVEIELNYLLKVSAPLLSLSLRYGLRNVRLTLQPYPLYATKIALPKHMVSNICLGYLKGGPWSVSG